MVVGDIAEAEVEPDEVVDKVLEGEMVGVMVGDGVGCNVLGAEDILGADVVGARVG